MTEQNTKKPKKKGVFIFSVAIVEIIIFLTGYALGTLNLTGFNSNKDNAQVVVDNVISEKGEIGDGTENDIVTPDNKTDEQSISETADEKTVEKIMKDMTLSDMVYQMMFVTPEAITKVGNVVQAGEATK